MDRNWLPCTSVRLTATFPLSPCAVVGQTGLNLIVHIYVLWYKKKHSNIYRCIKLPLNKYSPVKSCLKKKNLVPNKLPFWEHFLLQLLRMLDQVRASYLGQRGFKNAPSI